MIRIISTNENGDTKNTQAALKVWAALKTWPALKTWTDGQAALHDVARELETQFCQQAATH